MFRSPPRLRCVGVATAATGTAIAVTRLLTVQVDLTPFDVDDAVVQVCLLTLLGCVLWVWAATCAVVVEGWRGHQSVGRGLLGAPRVLRRCVLAACGVALVGVVAPPGHPSDDPLAGLPMPERAVGPAGPGVASTPVVRASANSVIVCPGDSLWLITARALPAGASDATITAGWHRLYLANRAVIGPDPDLLHPGQRLRRPTVPTN